MQAAVRHVRRFLRLTMKTSGALCTNGFQCGSDFYPKEIAISDKEGYLGLVYYIKLDHGIWKSLPAPQRKVFLWQSTKIFNFFYLVVSSRDRPFRRIHILIRQLQLGYNPYVENGQQQDYLFRSFGIHSAVIPASVTNVQTSLHCGLPQHNTGFKCVMNALC